jgi:hypothetical protein
MRAAQGDGAIRMYWTASVPTVCRIIPGRLSGTLSHRRSHLRHAAAALAILEAAKTELAVQLVTSDLA